MYLSTGIINLVLWILPCVLYLQLRLHEENTKCYHRISSPLVQLENATEIHWTHTLQLLDLKSITATG